MMEILEAAALLRLPDDIGQADEQQSVDLRYDWRFDVWMPA